MVAKVLCHYFVGSTLYRQKSRCEKSIYLSEISQNIAPKSIGPVDGFTTILLRTEAIIEAGHVNAPAE